MADSINIFRECGKCHGDGLFPNAYIDFEGYVVEPEETYPCPRCAGEGKLKIGSVSDILQGQLDDIEDKINDVLDKCRDIFEKLNELGGAKWHKQ